MADPILQSTPHDSPSAVGRRPTVLIVGAGYAGVRAASLLGHRRSAVDPILIAPEPYHSLAIRLHQVAAGRLDPRFARVPIAAVARRHGFRWRQDRLVGIDAATRQFVLAEGGAVAYDYAVLAFGGVPEWYGIPGMKEHAFTIGSWDGALALRERVLRLAASERAPTIAVVGGGLTGIELAGELAERAGWRIWLIEAAPTLLPGFPPRLQQRTADALRRRGVRVRTSTPVKQCAPVDGQGERLVLELATGDPLEADAVVWCGGVRAHPLISAHLPAGRAGRATADASLRSTADRGLFVAGDCAAAVDPSTQKPVPPTAQNARAQGELAARNILALCRSAPLAAYSGRSKGIVLSVGDRWGGAQIGPLIFGGWAVRQLKKMIEGYYRLHL